MSADKDDSVGSRGCIITRVKPNSSFTVVSFSTLGQTLFGPQWSL